MYIECTSYNKNSLKDCKLFFPITTLSYNPCIIILIIIIISMKAMTV